ncbi:MAG: hypothetical protein IPG66_05030 [Hydrogenophilales bacterium]|nr:hypothetical protein [Hydrogenophilales bacterium]
MRLGIVVTDIAYLAAVTRLIDAVRARDWQAECFLTDTGVMLLADNGFATRAKAVRNSVAVCEHSVERYAQDLFDVTALADDIVVGGQYQDAEMVHRCDKVLVF